MTIPNVNDSPMELTGDSAPAPAPKPDAPAPSPEPKPDSGAKPDAPAPAADAKPDGGGAEPTLYELPDGRKVDAATLTKEWSQNFLPEFTRRSQRLAELEGGPKRDITKDPQAEPEVPEWEKPDFVPKTYGDIIKIAKSEAIRDIEGRAQAETERVQAITASVESDLAEIRKIDPKLDENALFSHANKYGFMDLKAAYANMADTNKLVAATEERVTKNLQKREADPIAGGASGANAPSDAVDIGLIHSVSGAQEFLSRVRGK